MSPAGPLRREVRWSDSDAGRVVHVVGCVTDEVYSFLGPATHALARSGLDQSVVMIDDVRYRHHLLSLHERAELILTPSLRNPLRQWREVLKSLRQTLTDSPPRAVHLHGLVPCLVGAWAVRTSGHQAAIFYSPHGSRAMGRFKWIGATLLWLFRPLLQPGSNTAIVNVPQERRAFDKWKSVDVIESPAGAAFLGVARNEARHPLVVTGGRERNPRNAELLAQLAVLLTDDALRISFNWIGSVDKVSRLRLNAAGVSVFDVASDEERAQRLAAGWIYVAPGGTRGFPVYLVEAMAAGLPCVAMDTPQHSEVIRDGETGFLCESERDLIGCIATLVDSPSLRTRIGEAARKEARERFGEGRFSTRLLAAYSFDSPIATNPDPDSPAPLEGAPA
jgi:glycosyltransferase involved in cell wall biosynthesis